jgi:p-hydroxybenzoate 3-monooxygenase
MYYILYSTGGVVRIQVAVIGAGPAGMFLAHLLHDAGIDVVVLEMRNREYVEGRVRAGVLEQTTVQLMRRLGIGDRLSREGLVHHGTILCVDGDPIHLDFHQLIDGGSITVYGQSEVMKDLNDAAMQRGVSVIYDVAEVALSGLDGDRPSVSWTQAGAARRLDCDFVVGCDGFHGVSRRSIPAAACRTFERVYPFGWLGILADVPPCSDELIYANHRNGFALASMRSATRSRCYLQCPLDERVEDWSDARFWDEFCERIGTNFDARVTRGPSFEKSIAPLRSFVCETMRWGRLFLAGDAAHIVPPTGAKGLNLAVADVVVLAAALTTFFKEGRADGIDQYAQRALARVWKAERFSWWLTHLTHRFPHMDEFDRRMQVAEFSYLRSSRAAQVSFAENYVGLPLQA